MRFLGSIGVTGRAESCTLRPMFESLTQLVYALSLRFKSRARLEVENLVLRQQLNVLVRKLPNRDPRAPSWLSGLMS
jgi:hypothetical protein